MHFRHLTAALAGLLLLLEGRRDAAAAPSLSPEAVQQIQSLMEEKAARTPAQTKISSQLLYAAKQLRGLPISPKVPSLRLGVEVDTAGTTLVDVSCTVTPSVLDTIAALGGTVVSSFPQYDAVRASLPLAEVEALANLPEVRGIRPADLGVTNKLTASEGDVAHRAALARSTFGVGGSGVKVGVLSDSVDHLATVQATGDLGAVTVLAGQSGVGACGGPCTGEGTAMLEIVSDLAPGATLYFATGFEGIPSFATNILALRAAGCDIIVDDVSYRTESVFQDGLVAQAVNVVTADGALYFSSAGNSGNKNDGTSGVWEGDFVDSGQTFNGRPAHSFAGTVGNAITFDPPRDVTLQWSDPSGASTNDYDLYLFDSTGTLVLNMSDDVQNGTQHPIEWIPSVGNDLGTRLVIVKFSGAGRYLHLNTNRGRLAVNTVGQTSGHSAAVDAFSVAATTALGFTNPFLGGASNPVEGFSSDGPRRIFYFANGAAITPGNFSSTGGTVRQKPDITAADCVKTSTPGFNPFCGTSAAAPHAAAIAALVKSINPGLTTAQVRTVLTSTALDIEALGVDRDSGAGVLNAFAAVQLAAPSTPTPAPSSTPSATRTSTPTPASTGTPVKTATPTPTVSPTPTPTGTPVGLRYFSLSPCRVIDSRDAPGPRGGSPLAQGETYAFDVAGLCGVPSTARAVVGNVVGIAPTAGGFLTLYPAGVAMPATSALNFRAGQTRANNLILSLGLAAGRASIFNGAGGQSHFLLDVTGYFE